MVRTIYLPRIYWISLCLSIFIPKLNAQQGLNKFKLDGSINSPQVEYAPSISADGQTMVFQSNRRGKYEIFIIRKDLDGNWGIPGPIDAINNFGTKNDLIGGPTLSFDGNYIYFFATFKGGVGIEDIYYSVRQGMEWSKPINAGRNINSRGYDAFPSISSDGKSLYFVRRAPKSPDANTFCTQIMVSERSPDGIWSKPTSLPASINTVCEKCPRILSDNETLMFSRINLEENGDFDLYISRKDVDGSWSSPEPLDFINTEVDDLFASVPSTGDFLYFNNKISGSYDMYSAPLPAEFRPRQVIDVQGIVTNSEGEPVEAYFDILRGGKSQNNNSLTSNSEDGAYTMVLVEGFKYIVKVSAEGYEPYELPFNLTDIDEYKLIEQSIELKKIKRELTLEIRDKKRDVALDVNFEASGKDLPEMAHDTLGFYSLPLNYSEQIEFLITRKGYDTIDFSFTLDMSMIDSAHQVVYMNPGVPHLILNVSDEETNLALNPNLDLRKSKGRRTVFKDIIRGTYETDLEYNQDFQIRLRLRGYFFHQDTIDLKGIYDGRVIKRDIKMIPLKAGNKLTLNNVNFKVNSADLSVDSQEILDEVALLLRQNRGLVIEVGAHSDDLGEESYNKSLSEKRAQSVKDFLITKGVSERALRVKGYGESTPLVPNDSDENRAKNRRVEFSIIRS